MLTNSHDNDMVAHGTSSLYNRYKTERNLCIDSTYDLPLSELEAYFDANDIENCDFFKEFKDYKESNLNYVSVVFSTLLQHFADEKLLKDNKEFYSEIASFLEYAFLNNLLHVDKKKYYESFLKDALFQDNKNSINSDALESLEALDYSQYEHNNFRTTYNDEAINNINQRGGAIFLNIDGKICCRLSKESELKVYSKRQAGTILSAALRYAIEITEDIPKHTDIDTSVIFLSNASVVDVDDEKK